LYSKNAVFLVSLCVALMIMPGLSGSSQTPPPASVYAIVGAKIEIGDGRVIDKGVVVVRDGIIVAVGADVKPPPDAEVLKGDGLTVYPGFIDSYVSKGLTLPDPQPIQDTPTDTTSTVSPSMREANRKGVRPELRAADFLTLTDDLLKAERQAGFTSEMVTPNGGTINGVGCIVNLNGLTRRDCVVSPSSVMDFSFGTSGSGYPGSQMGIIAHTRQTLLDAQRYAILKQSFADGVPPRPPDDPVLAALQPVLGGSLPALYTANTEREIRRAIGLADEFKLQLWINGGIEAFKAAQELSAKHVPVIVSLNFGAEPGVTPPPAGPGTGGGPGGSTRPGGGGGRRRPGGAPGTPGAPAGTPGAAPPTSPGGTPGSPGGNQPGRQGANPAGAQPGSAASGSTPAPPVDENTPKVVVAERHKKWEEKVANAGQLNKAGVQIALSTQGLRNQTEFMTNLRKAITAGLPRAAALKALTLDAARMLKVDQQLGTVEVGKSAAIVVMNGDFADARTTVQYLLIDRVKFEPAKDAGPLIQLPSRRRPGTDIDEYENQ
jgi:imidazolonepropionase-like amidohydrolase